MSSIITFYSFKGGVGRTMALANIAVRLVQRGRRVLVVDFDLEAPGLDRYFSSLPSEGDGSGLMQLLSAAQRGGGANEWRRHLSRVDVFAKESLDLMSAGQSIPGYASDVAMFDWNRFFEESGGGDFIERLRDIWKEEYDFTLIDSRTGLTDAGGICTIQLPDIAVAMFGANEQSLIGVSDVIARAQAGRQRLGFDRMPLMVVPVAARFDGRAEVEEARKWMGTFADVMGPHYEPWIPRSTDARRVLERTKIPHIPYFSFGEKLPVISHGITDPEGLGYAYESLASLIDNDLDVEAAGLFKHDLDAHGDRETQEFFSQHLMWLYKEIQQDAAMMSRQLVIRRLLLSAAVAIAIGLAMLASWIWPNDSLLSEIAGAVAAISVAAGATYMADSGILYRSRKRLQDLQALEDEALSLTWSVEGIYEHTERYERLRERYFALRRRESLADGQGPAGGREDTARDVAE